MGTRTGTQAVSKSDAEAFAFSLLTKFEVNPFSSLGKAELELAIFEAYLDASVLNLEMSDFEISLVLRVPVSKVKSLRYRHRLNNSRSGFELHELTNSIIFVSVNEATNLVTISVDDVFFRELLTSELRANGAATDSSFSRSILKVDVDKFFIALEALGGLQLGALQQQVSSAKRKYKSKNLATAINRFLLEFAAGSIPALVSQFIK